MSALLPFRYSPTVEVVPADEEEKIQQLIEVLRSLLEGNSLLSGEKRRDVHVKSHGCPFAHFQVLTNLSSDLRQGMFAHPGAYSAAVRFSNSSPMIMPDVIPDGRGVAIKLRGVTGNFINSESSDSSTQDFLMVNHPVFIAKDVDDYLQLQRARLMASQSLWGATELLTGGNWSPFSWKWNQAFITAGVLSRSLFPITQLTYYSMSPFRYGDYIAKYRLKPLTRSVVSAFNPIRSVMFQSSGLRLQLEQALRTSSLSFEFQIQLRTSHRSMPIEDACVDWSQRESPFRTVALLLIPQQELSHSPFGTGDSLFFNVWNSLVEHRPLGGINRARRAAYEVSANWRRFPSIVSQVTADGHHFKSECG